MMSISKTALLKIAFVAVLLYWATLGERASAAPMTKLSPLAAPPPTFRTVVEHVTSFFESVPEPVSIMLLGGCLMLLGIGARGRRHAP